MRDFDFRYSGLKHRQSGGAAAVIGDIVWAATAPQSGGVWENAALVSPNPPLTVAGSPDLFAVQGGVINRVAAANANSAATLAAASTGTLGGAIYGVNEAGQVRKRASAMGNYGSVLWTVSPAPTQGARILYGPTRMVIVWSTSNAIRVETVRSDSDRTTFQTGYNDANHPWRLFEVGPGIMLLLRNGNDGILRTTNDGVSWSIVGAGSSTFWAAWRSGANIHMFGSSGQLTTSTNDGATWSGLTSVPNGTGFVICTANGASVGQYSNAPAAAVNTTARVGAFLTTGGEVRTWNLDNPAAGFTTALAAGTLPTNQNSPFWGSSGAFWATSNVAGKQGLWYALASAPTVWRLAAPASAITGFDYRGFNDMAGMEIGDGLVTHDPYFKAATMPGSLQFANVTNTFDPYVVPDLIPLFNGMTPWRRVA